ncbi:MAG: hypothetical protein J6C07_05965 [Lachnospiraceae bacterium]|nr:hypothetical protein [Lachnospiraceae bacterium]
MIEFNNEATFFGRYLKGRRKRFKVSAEQLSSGLFDESQISKIEQGERYPSKLSRDRLLGRLGENGYDFECYLKDEEHEKWVERCCIVSLLERGRLEEAELRIKAFQESVKEEHKLEKQFMLVMQAQLLELQGEPEEEVWPLVEEAVSLTVPQIGQVPVSELVLSVQELNLVLEYYSRAEQECMEEYCLDLLHYMEREYFDPASKAMLCPKIALYFGKYVRKHWKRYNGAERYEKAKKVLEVCHFGLECLRDHKKIYFAVELLEIQNFFLNEVLKNEHVIEPGESDGWKKAQEETTRFLKMLKNLYREFQVPLLTPGYLHFYKEHELYSYGEVVRSRRKMLGLSREKLTGLVDIRTLERLENKGIGSQRGTVRLLFEHMGLSTMLHRAQVVTESQDAILLEKKLRQVLNQKQYEEAEGLLGQLREWLPMEFRINMQYISYWKTYISYQLERLSKAEYVEQAIQCLEMTISLKAAMKEIKDVQLRNGCVRRGEKYLTNTEVTILMHLAITHGKNITNEYYDALREYYEWMETRRTISEQLGMYGFVMSGVASYLGDRGEFTDSNKISKNLVEESLYARSLDYVERNLYSMMWNKKEQQGFDEQNPEWRNCLETCIDINLYTKDEFMTEWLRKKLG